MNAGDLNSAHLGQKILVKDVRSDVVVSGTLAGLRHDGDRIQDLPLSREYGAIVIGRITVVLEFVNGTTVRTSTTAPVELIQ